MVNTETFKNGDDYVKCVKCKIEMDFVDPATTIVHTRDGKNYCPVCYGKEFIYDKD